MSSYLIYNFSPEALVKQEDGANWRYSPLARVWDRWWDNPEMVYPGIKKKTITEAEAILYQLEGEPLCLPTG